MTHYDLLLFAFLCFMVWLILRSGRGRGKVGCQPLTKLKIERMVSDE